MLICIIIYVKERGLEQAAHGVYVSPDTWTDAMYILHLRCGQAVFSHETGITIMQTPFGHSVPVYDMERTICDLLRSRKNVEMQVFQDALKQYAKRKDKNLRMLMKYATMFHVENILRPYLEVLL